jgi:hypothetical protein
MKTRSLAEVGLVLIAFYVLTTAVLALGTHLTMFVAGIESTGTLKSGLWQFASAVLPAALYALSAWGILAFRTGIARWLFPDEAIGDERPTATAATWEPQAYRLGFTLVGIFALASALPRAVWMLAMTLDLMRRPQSRMFTSAPGGTIDARTWLNIIGYAVHIGFVAYLALGAPRIRQWLLKRNGKEDGNAAAPAE